MNIKTSNKGNISKHVDLICIQISNAAISELKLLAVQCDGHIGT